MDRFNWRRVDEEGWIPGVLTLLFAIIAWRVDNLWVSGFLTGLGFAYLLRAVRKRMGLSD